MTLRARLLLAFAAVALLVALPAVYGLQRLREIRDLAVDLRGRHAEATMAIGRVQGALADVDRFERSHVASPSLSARRSVADALADGEAALALLRETGYGEVSAPLARTFGGLRPAVTGLDRLVEERGVDVATEYFFDVVRPLLERAEDRIAPVAASVDARGTVAATRAREISQAASRTTLLALLLSGAGGILLAFHLSALLRRPILRLRAAMATVAEGRFEAPEDLSCHRADEIGDLSRSFRSMTEQLDRLQRLKAEFVSIVTHDLKTPINVISGYVDMVRDGVFGPTADGAQDALTAVREQASVLDEQVGQLMNLSRLEAGTYRMEMKEVWLDELGESVRQAFAALARQKRIDFSVRVERSAPETIVADRERLRNEVLGNLLSNAFKFTEAEGRIAVRFGAADEPGHVLVEVSDSGVGIPEEEQPHVFDRYYQGGEGGRVGGTGLGLAIAQEMVAIHHGDISLESATGEGTTFRMVLPVDRRASGRDGDREADRTPRSRQRDPASHLRTA